MGWDSIGTVIATAASAGVAFLAVLFRENSKLIAAQGVQNERQQKQIDKCEDAHADCQKQFQELRKLLPQATSAKAS